MLTPDHDETAARWRALEMRNECIERAVRDIIESGTCMHEGDAEAVGYFADYWAARAFHIHGTLSHG